MVGDMNGYLAPDVPAKQWEVVAPQLAEMRGGNVPAIWEAVRDALTYIWTQDWRYRLTLLDAGCSSAYFSEIIKHYVPEWIEYRGMDSSPYMVEEAAKHYPDVKVDLGDMRWPPYSYREFDIVMTGATLNHIVEWQQALKELARIAGRYLLLHRLPFTEGPTRIEGAEAYGHWVHALFFNELEFGIVLSDRGFTRIYDVPVDDLRTQIWERA